MSVTDTHNEQEVRRRQELECLRERTAEVYPYSFEQTFNSRQILDSFTQDDASAYADVAVAGRLMIFRRMGKATFAHLQDDAGRIQIYFKKDDLGDAYDDLRFLDIGDVLGVRGYVFKTRTGETTVHAVSFKLLTKCLTPIPVPKEEIDADGTVRRYDAFTNKEHRYRRRYLDLIVNPQIKETFRKRASIISTMRKYFDNRGWLEVETPILQPLYGGASARPFITHHNALDVQLYLRIADELYLKRLIVGGFEGVYEISKNFRNEGMDKTHNPEYTAMEIYVAYKDYLWMMDMTEDLIWTITQTVTGSSDVSFGGDLISFNKPFSRISMRDGFIQHAGDDAMALGLDELRLLATRHGVEFDPAWHRMKLLDEIFGEVVQPHFIQPTFVMDYPVEMSPLAKKHRSHPGIVERFELYIAGKEVANAFSELNDPTDQHERLVEQALLRANGDDEAMVVDEDFIYALEVGMPPTAGLGIGIDRLVMILTDNESIRDVILFPQMKPERPGIRHQGEGGL